MTYDTLTSLLLPHYERSEARAIARLVMESLCGLSQTDMLLGREADIKETIIARLREGEPVQYVLGWAQFCGLRIGVAPGVLIPRPETEGLLSPTIATTTDMRILDICTGSGCIALALKQQYPTANVEAWDISDEALTIAKQNASDLALNVDFLKVDALHADLTCGERYALIVSNPPYVTETERADMADHVLNWEPSLALFVPDESPLLFYEALARIAQHLLLPDGEIRVECNTAYCQQVADLFTAAGLRHAHIVNDCYDKPRFVMAQK